MHHLLDKLVLLLLTSLFYLSFHLSVFSVLFILVAISFACINSYYEKQKISYIIQVMYFILCIFYFEYLFFIPLIAYETFHKKEQYWLSFYLILLLVNLENITLLSFYGILLLALLSCVLHFKSNKIMALIALNKKVKDDSEELKIIQEQKQKELLERQDYEIQLAKAEERNRIAREIHDSVGHNLSSSLLQIGAMIAINKDASLQEPLENMKHTLSDGMDSIRISVHDLHEDSLNLEKEMQKIINQFPFCPIAFHCRITNLLDLKLKYCFINILKEALNNIIKHSNATKVNVSFLESPAFYQFIIQDNGTNIARKEGLGLKSMQERVDAYHGICRFSDDKGFKIFINIPKEDSYENHNHRR